MRADPSPEPGDLARAPFSNGTEGEMWLAAVCGGGSEGLGCIHDSTFGRADPDGDEIHCPLITLSLLQVWPHEWAVEQVPWTDGKGQQHSYDRPGMCSEYAEDLPPEQPDPVIAVDLFRVYAAEPPC